MGDGRFAICARFHRLNTRDVDRGVIVELCLEGEGRTVVVTLRYAHLGIKPGCWQLHSLYSHDGKQPRVAKHPVDPGMALSAVRINDIESDFEMTVGPRGMGVWGLQPCS